MNEPMPTEANEALLVPLKIAGFKAGGWSPGATYQAARTGRFPLPIIKVGSRSYVRRADLEAFARGDLPQTSPTHVAESA
jgi:hypothetical protein